MPPRVRSPAWNLLATLCLRMLRPFAANFIEYKPGHDTSGVRAAIRFEERGLVLLQKLLPLVVRQPDGQPTRLMQQREHVAIDRRVRLASPLRRGWSRSAFRRGLPWNY